MSFSKLPTKSQVIGSKGLFTPQEKLLAAKRSIPFVKKSETAILAKYPDATPFDISQAFDYLQKKAFRVSIFDREKRCDGRGFHDIRLLQRRSWVVASLTWFCPFLAR